MTFEIVGEHNTATVQTELSKDEAEDGVIEQIQEMVDHPALAGDDDVVIMPDFHVGSGAVIGFTMPLKDRVVPNIVGVDIGCGMSYAYLNDYISPEQWDDEVWAETLDEEIRNTVPFGFNVYDDPPMHLTEDFPFAECEAKLESLLNHLSYDTDDLPEWFDGYGERYFKDLCDRVEYDTSRAVNSLGTLGGGNHFIELSESSETGQVVVTVHSGSRGIGAAIANHWQDEAHQRTFERQAVVEVPKGELQYFEQDSIEFVEYTEPNDEPARVRPDSLSINREAILEDYDGEAIEGKFGQLKSFMNAGKSDKSDLDWLEGTEALGYYVDMIFAQTYASESRRLMIEQVTDVLDTSHDGVQESVHNYIDFDDGTIRKGATPARDGEQVLIPYNMRDGSVIAEGSGNGDWNNSAPHGAGRVMSRTRAKNELDKDDVVATMDGIQTTEIPLDEAPQSYKETDEIEAVLGDTVETIDRLEVLHNLKAE